MGVELRSYDYDHFNPLVVMDGCTEELNPDPTVGPHPKVETEDQRWMK